MYKRTRTIVAFGLLSTVAACSSSVSSDAKALNDGDALTPVVLARAHYSGFNAAERLVVRDQSEFASVWATTYGSVNPDPALPAVDFAQETVLVAALGTRNSGGYSIAIDSVVANATGADVFVTATSPGVRCGTTQALTQPVTIVKIAAVEGTVTFREQSQIHACE